MSKSELRFDEIGYWSEVKLDIVREYASAYSKILSAQRRPSLHHVYIDAFAGAGLHRSRTSGEFVPGSPLNALAIQPPFKEYHFIDIDARKVEALEEISRNRKEVSVYEGDCNTILSKTVFPRVKYSEFRRGLCVLDPYGMDLDSDILQMAGRMKSLDIFLNFPVMDMNRNVLWKNPTGVNEDQKERMNRFWGDTSWQSEVYDGSGDLFGYESKVPNEEVAERFCDRLRVTAGFGFVPAPIPMRNSKGSTVYFLVFASQKSVAKNIVRDIFDKYQTRMA